MPQGVEWVLHCAWVIAAVPSGVPISCRNLAEYHGVPDAYLSKQLQALVRAGILVATGGPRGGFRLSRPAEEITVADVVEAIDGSSSLFFCTEIRKRGPDVLPPDCHRQACGIATVMRDAEEVWRAQLSRTTVADLVDSAPQEARQRAVRWAALLKASGPPARGASG